MEELVQAAVTDPAAAADLADAFAGDIAFGTAGLRSQMAPGFNRMNRITVQLASQGVAEYLHQRGAHTVVVGCDHRHQSRVFADTAMRCMQKMGIAVLGFSSVVPTPFVPFAVKGQNANFGIMITASHNPAADNGYKVYGGNACQIVAPTDRDIAQLIAAQHYRLWELTRETQFKDIYDATCEAYVQSNRQLFSPLFAFPLGRPSTPPKIVYTAMHGVGWKVVHRLLTATDRCANLLPVPSQQDPHPDFPTTAFPNPEEGLVALHQAITYAEQVGATMIFANDPDADRFNCAERQVDGQWHLFTGNEIAFILAEHLWQSRQLLFPQATAFAMAKSCVSSKLLSSMGRQEGFQVLETLTGFKHLSNAAQQLEAASKGTTKVLLAYEEAIGYMVNTAVWDKDGISALLLMRLVLDQVTAKGMTLGDHLVSLYRRYGYFAQYNSYYICQPASRAVAIFQKLRERLATRLGRGIANLTGPCSLDGEMSMVESIKDYPNSTMITLYLSKDQLSWLTLRASGTEPKIKFYSERCCAYEERLSLETILHTRTDRICDWLLSPEANNLKRQGR